MPGFLRAAEWQPSRWAPLEASDSTLGEQGTRKGPGGAGRPWRRAGPQWETRELGAPLQGVTSDKSAPVGNLGVWVADSRLPVSAARLALSLLLWPALDRLQVAGRWARWEE